MDDKRIEALEKRTVVIEEKLDTIIDMVSLGKHLILVAKAIAWVGSVYIAVQTYIHTVLTK